MTIRPCDLVGHRRLLDWPMKFVNDLLRDKIYCTTIVNNQISRLVFNCYPRVEFLSYLPFSSSLSYVLSNQRMTRVRLSSFAKSSFTTWALEFSFLRLRWTDARFSKHVLNTNSFLLHFWNGFTEVLKTELKSLLRDFRNMCSTRKASFYTSRMVSQKSWETELKSLL